MLCLRCCDQITELGQPSVVLERHLHTLWRFHEPVTFEHFDRVFKQDSSNKELFPVVDVVLKFNRELPLIKYAKDVLAWHSVIFTVLKPGSITREDAEKLSNQDVIDRIVDSSERAAAASILTSFCEAFNSTIVMPGLLYECADNIFVNEKTGEVDLEVTKGAQPAVRMGPSCSVAFSLPSSVKNAEGYFLDPRSLCTMFILNSLKVLTLTLMLCTYEHVVTEMARCWRFSCLIYQAFQETTVNALLNASSSSDFGKESSSQAMHTNQKKSDYNIPVTTFLTPSALVSSRLLAYDSDVHLMPAVRTFVKQVGLMWMWFSLSLFTLFVCLPLSGTVVLIRTFIVFCFSDWNSVRETS